MGTLGELTGWLRKLECELVKSQPGYRLQIRRRRRHLSRTLQCWQKTIRDREVRKAFCAGEMAGEDQTQIWVQGDEWTDQ